jgi:acetolactate decarboxylase
MRLSRFISSGFLILVFACTSKQVQPLQLPATQQTITQVSTMDALLQGLYDGSMALSELKVYGDFGIGAYDKLDGEMIFVDGQFYQIKADGIVYLPDESNRSPFATVTRFENESVFPIQRLSLDGFKLFADSIKQSDNLFYAIRIKGKFSSVTTRSVPAQSKPYPTMVDVVKNQSVFELTDISGQIVGFYCPDFVKGVNVPGYHLHFLSDDKKSGGHILSFNLIDGNLWLDQINRYEMILPDAGDFLKGEFKTDRSDDLKKVIQN